MRLVTQTNDYRKLAIRQLTFTFFLSQSHCLLAIRQFTFCFFLSQLHCFFFTTRFATLPSLRNRRVYLPFASPSFS